jgi:two-component system chemotaxis sensor kinase CheA
VKIEEIQDIFFQECEEGLTQTEAGLLAIQSGQHNSETINTVFRAVHSIKGGSGAFGFTGLQHFTHHFETLLDQLRDGRHVLTQPLIEALLGAFDMLTDHVSAIRGEKPIPDDSAMLRRLQDIATGEPATVSADSTPEVDSAADLGFNLDDLIGSLDDGPIGDPDWQKDSSEASAEAEVEAEEQDNLMFVRPSRGAMAHGGEPLLLIRELIDLGGIICNVDWSAVPGLAGFDPEEAYLGWHIDLPPEVSHADVQEIFEFVADDCILAFGKEAEANFHQEGAGLGLVAFPDPEPFAASKHPETAVVDLAEQPAPAVPAATIPATTPPPATTVGGVTEAAAAPAAPVGVTPTIRVDLEKLDRLVNLVGELVITQAMLAQRLLNCGLASINELSDLDHLTRELQDSAMSIRAQPISSVFNRVPRIVRELQASTGKRVRLEVEGETTELDKTVVERIGEPLTHLIRNAIDHGLESPEDRISAGKSAEGRVRLSAEHRSGRIMICVSDDGRGINRDRIFAKAVERGLVMPDAKLSDEEIENLIFAPGFSTAAAISNISGRGVGLDVVRRNVQSLGGRITISSRPGEGSTFTMSLPLTLAILDGMIVSTGGETYVIPLTHIIESLRPMPEDVKHLGTHQQMINVRGSWLPIQSVGRALGIKGAQTDPAQAVLIVVESETGQAVLMIDEILDQRQVVIKSLETNYRQVDGVAGATILGDGRVALILDVESVTAGSRPQDDFLLRARA